VTEAKKLKGEAGGQGFFETAAAWPVANQFVCKFIVAVNLRKVHIFSPQLLEQPYLQKIS